MHLRDPVAQMQPATALLDVVEDRAREPAVGRAFEQVEFGGLGFGGKHHEDREHAAGRDRLAINEAQGIGDRIPHPLNALLTAAMAHKPLLEADPIQGSDRLHGSLVVH